MDQSYWRKCIVCKNEIKFKEKYYKCSVNSCDKKRAPAQFCTVDCWDIHRSIMSHKSAGADEYKSPTKDEWAEEQKTQRVVKLVSKLNVDNDMEVSAANTDDILVVVSKLKAYVKGSSDLNTSADVMPELSKIIRKICDKAVVNAHAADRKTLMARDF